MDPSGIVVIRKAILLIIFFFNFTLPLRVKLISNYQNTSRIIFSSTKYIKNCECFGDLKKCSYFNILVTAILDLYVEFQQLTFFLIKPRLFESIKKIVI